MKIFCIRSTCMLGKTGCLGQKNQGETWEQKQDLHCGTGMKIQHIKWQQKHTVQFCITCTKDIMTTKQKR